MLAKVSLSLSRMSTQNRKSTPEASAVHVYVDGGLV